MELQRVNRHYIETRQTPLGFGAFATAYLEAHEIVGEITGQINEDADYDSDYCIDLGGTANLEPTAPFRYLNHSCEPNCELVLWKTHLLHGREYSRLWLQTLRSINSGEELTIDYAWPAEVAIPCRCRSPRCRGWIVHHAEAEQLRTQSGAYKSAPLEPQSSNLATDSSSTSEGHWLQP